MQEKLKEWFDEIEEHKIFNGNGCRFVIHKGFKITNYFDDDTYTIQVVNKSDFYGAINAEEEKVFRRLGFKEGARELKYRSDLKWVKYYENQVEKLYKRKLESQRAKSRSKTRRDFHTKRVKNAMQGITEANLLLQSYKSQIAQYEAR